MEIYNREKELRLGINKFLSSITKVDKNYIESFTQEQLLQLKSAVSDINNVLTLKITLAFADWIKEFISLTNEEYEKLIKNINSTKPNTNGFDIWIKNKKIIVEIKAIIPINEGDYYAAAQKDSILMDAVKLINGKKELKDTSNYYKFIGLIDIGDKTDKAIEKIMTKSERMISEDPKRIKMYDVIDKLKLVDNKIKLDDLRKDSVYIKKIRLN